MSVTLILGKRIISPTSHSDDIVCPSSGKLNTTSFNLSSSRHELSTIVQDVHNSIKI